MYDQTFSKFYEEYGWDFFSLTMGESLLKYFENFDIKIRTNIDLCCGTGTLCDFFYKHNIETKGIDISNDMIKIAKEKNKNIDFICENVLDYKDNQTYDLVTITCDAINHITGADELDILFKNINKLTNKSGYLVFDILDPSKVEYDKQIISNRDNDIKVYYYITSKKECINTNVVIKKDDTPIYETNVIERLYNLDYIKKLLETNGFEILKADNKILNEKQRVNDKIYIICKKI